MLLLSLPLLLLLPLSTSAINPPRPLPFHAPYLNTSPLLNSLIHARADNCPNSFYSCTTLSPSYGGACCSDTSLCALDDASNIACCPVGSKCTGILSSPSSPTRTTAAPASTVSNPYFPYPYIPTSFANSAECETMASQCAQNFRACTLDIEGGFGVTVMVPGGGGVTVAPVVTGAGSGGGGVPAGEAGSVCSSLSSVACEGASGGCERWGSKGTFAVAEKTSVNGAPARVTGLGMAGVVGLGVVRGLM